MLSCHMCLIKKEASEVLMNPHTERGSALRWRAGEGWL